ncbi:endoplasmic reticulum-Golgi intermediate compartment protein 2-like isoform X2 [Dreissena polymorpha]|uniref:endoplasmic reticulum-Golgi intermediate compartment protein 2-like isoform X2 n=1 Tax=Dreissena polymorpha TaxID=45954 RepID=UPI002264DE80|nr:endoplasmic reticulum-Golgi intermediate compartment protein 2-like isoform X2 [Dreissena polymorpha]
MRRAAVANKSPQSKVLKVVTEFDAFPKVPDNFKETTAAGGGIAVVTFVFIFILVLFEFMYYTNTKLKFDYEVDTEVDGKIKINIDMTIAMKCEYIGADVLDQTGQDTHSFGTLLMDPTHYTLTPAQQSFRDITRRINQYLKDEYHAIQELLWLSGAVGVKMGSHREAEGQKGPMDACRVHGSLEVNKVAGNFHITAGKSLKTNLGHLHISSMLSNSDYNFTHRIDHFSFGEVTSGIVNPLDGEEQVTQSNYHLFQYFMKIVPTKVRTYANQVDTYQYSVTERSRPIDHSHGSHGVPGIFIKYEPFSFKVVVREEHLPYSQFLVRLCGIVGGIFVVSGMLHDSVGVIVDIMCCRFKLGRYSPVSTATQPLLVPESEASLAHGKSLLSTSSVDDQSYTPVQFASGYTNHDLNNSYNGQTQFDGVQS